ncbi:MAG: histidine ammonia-lyase [Thermotogota bacterium]|nr:histidine ammonia-lyase [Thermotogota bacterium]
MIKIGDPVSIDDMVKVGRYKEKVKLSAKAETTLEASYERLKSILQSHRTVYGVNTGFGALVDVKITDDELRDLQMNILKSHAAGIGEPLKEEIVRGMIFLRAVSLSKGFSGVRTVIVKRLIDFLNLDLVPVVPRTGSVGASGDLAPLSHVALALIGEGEVFYEGRRTSAREALEKAGIEPLVLEAKEGLALVNGTQAMCSVAGFALNDAFRLFDLALIAAAMSVDALLGSTDPFDPRLHQVRPHPGQQEVAERLRELLEGSEIRDYHRTCHNVQDAYTMRTLPQVYGAVLDTLNHARKVLEVEMNSVTDNPLIFSRGSEVDVISGGNFHGEPIALVCDFCSIALTDMMNMMERRIDRILNPNTSRGLPAFLAKGREGLNSGYMLWQYTAAAIASWNKVLAHPASADSIPTSAYQEDHVSMGMNAALKFSEIVENLKDMVAIELMLAARALQFREPLKTSPALQPYKEELLSKMMEYHHDVIFREDFIKVRDFVEQWVTAGKDR